ncbi:MAG: hypothetical protein JJT78_05615 [Leptospira sp.]|nr:hypothetical protein [Leptospira sp.]
MMKLFYVILLSTFAYLGCNLKLERDDRQNLTVLGVFGLGGTSSQFSEFTVGGQVNNLNGSGLVLRLNGVEDLPITESGSFIFSTRLQLEETYQVNVATQPSSPAQSCTLQNNSGSILGNVDDITVNCLDIPVLSEVEPGNFERLEPSNSVVIRFSKTMNTGSCNLNFGSGSSLLVGNAYSVDWSETNLENDTLTISPNSTWNIGINRVLRISECSDTDGLVAESGGSLDFELRFFVTATTDALRYVATNGTDSGSCTDLESPCATINFAYSELNAVTDCATNKDCAVLVQSGDYELDSTLDITNGRSIIGSFNSNFQSRNVFNSPTNILPTNITGCGAIPSNICRTVQIVNVTEGTRVETIRILGKENQVYSHTLNVGPNSVISLDTVIAISGGSNEASALSEALHVEGNTINLSINGGVYSISNMTGTSSEASVIRVAGINSVNVTIRGGSWNIRNATTRYGFRLTNTSAANIDIRNVTMNLSDSTVNSNVSYGIRLENNLNGSEFLLANSTISSFSANETAYGISIESGNEWTNSPLPLIYNNRISGGRINSDPGHISRGVNLQRFGGLLINNSIVGGSSTGDGSVVGLSSLNSPSAQLIQNSIASGSGNSEQSAVTIDFEGGGNSENWVIFNNNFASNTNSSSVCLNYISATNPVGHIIRNNNFHSCSGGHAKTTVGSYSYYRSNCAGTAGEEGNLSRAAGCVDPLSADLTATVSGNIDVNASFQNANPTESSVNIWDWNLNLLTNGNTPCVLSRGAVEFTMGYASNILDIFNVDRRNNTRTNSDTAGIANLPANADGRSMGAYEFDGTCQ